MKWLVLYVAMKQGYDWNVHEWQRGIEIETRNSIVKTATTSRCQKFWRRTYRIICNLDRRPLAASHILLNWIQSDHLSFWGKHLSLPRWWSPAMIRRILMRGLIEESVRASNVRVYVVRCTCGKIVLRAPLATIFSIFHKLTCINFSGSRPRWHRRHN